MKFQMKEEGFVGNFPYGELDISSNENFGYSPLQLLISAIAGCSGGLLVQILRKMRMDIDGVELHADVERNENRPYTVDKVQLHFIISGSNLHKNKIDKALAWTEKNCTIVQSVKGSIAVEKSYEIIDSTNKQIIK